jgi:hypothetical protein
MRSLYDVFWSNKKARREGYRQAVGNVAPIYSIGSHKEMGHG